MMIKIISVFSCLIILGSCTKLIDETIGINCNLESDLTNHPKGAEFQTILDDHVAMGLPGIAIQLVSPQGTWTGASGLADIRNNIPFTPCHISKTGSITKLFIGALTMKLVEEGSLSLDDPISDYVDEDILQRIQMMPDIRIRNLMNHTTAIFDLISSTDFYLRIVNNPGGDWNQEELLKYVYDKEPYELTENLPAKYSNTNTLLLTMCLESATGKSHGSLLREKVFETLQLNDSYYGGYESVPEICAQGYFDLHNNQELYNVSNFNTGNGNGYTGLYSTVFDLNKFTRALFVDQNYLSSESLDLMLENLLPISNDDNGDVPRAGLNLFKKYYHLEFQGVGHEGGDLGYAANTFYFEDTETLVSYLVNYGTNGNSHLKPVYKAFDLAIMSELQK